MTNQPILDLETLNKEFSLFINSLTFSDSLFSDVKPRFQQHYISKQDNTILFSLMGKLELAMQNGTTIYCFVDKKEIVSDIPNNKKYYIIENPVLDITNNSPHYKPEYKQITYDFWQDNDTNKNIILPLTIDIENSVRFICTFKKIKWIYRKPNKTIDNPEIYVIANKFIRKVIDNTKSYVLNENYSKEIMLRWKQYQNEMNNRGPHCPCDKFPENWKIVKPKIETFISEIMSIIGGNLNTNGIGKLNNLSINILIFTGKYKYFDTAISKILSLE